MERYNEKPMLIDEESQLAKGDQAIQMCFKTIKGKIRYDGGISHMSS